MATKELFKPKYLLFYENGRNALRAKAIRYPDYTTS